MFTCAAVVSAAAGTPSSLLFSFVTSGHEHFRLCLSAVVGLPLFLPLPSTAEKWLWFFKDPCFSA